MIRRLSALCGALTLLATLGCGNKGPLYLPQEDPEKAAESTMVPAPQGVAEPGSDKEE